MKQALVTGGSGDIGAAICQNLAQQGLHVIVHAMNRPERAEHVAASILEFGGSAESVCFDVTDAEASRKILENELADRPIQVIVNNAGIHDDAPLAGMSHEQWHRVVDVSLHGFYNVTQPLLLPMMRTRWGRVIAVSSVAAQLGNRGQANYAAAKAGLHGAIKSLSQELASRGITANIVAPGIIQGEMTDNTFDKETIKKMVPAQRAGKPEEVADLVAFLASDRAAYISGQVIGINGGIV
ncbi:3-oxoacyl-[acyl-carrier-protein] reductase FabG [bacterium BMS3Bbin11]|nr:3-oxoacyl-[acyl-carrier-protein] reductase FabG [bacterium BMS3Abin11]GBE45400.1 3-oxoacyl-[acyl-carrier-protein] reductase FabG [bacterium BMS3Bbin11]GMT41232.1 MAG: 3-ketoacyl-ACP reductase [bacterium]